MYPQERPEPDSEYVRELGWLESAVFMVAIIILSAFLLAKGQP